MALFDRLSRPLPQHGDRSRYAQFDTFFAVMTEIGFVREAQRRGIKPVILFVSDTAPATARAYAELRQPGGNGHVRAGAQKSVSVMFEKADFPPTRPEFGVIRIPRLSAIVRGVVDRPSFSFAEYMSGDRPGGPTEMHSWIGNIFTEFRELELRLLMGKLSASLGGGGETMPREVRREH